MGRIQEQVREARFDIIRKTINGSPQTTQEIATLLETTYATARRDLMDLEKRGEIKPHILRGANGKTQWTLGRTRPMPCVIIGSSGQTQPVAVLSDAYIATLKVGGNKTTEAALTVLAVAADLMHKVAYMESGGEVEQAHLLPLRKELIEARKFLNSTADIADQLLQLVVLWDPETLVTIQMDDQWDNARMVNNMHEAAAVLADKAKEAEG